jgi:hypothetical protein
MSLRIHNLTDSVASISNWEPFEQFAAAGFGRLPG